MKKIVTAFFIVLFLALAPFSPVMADIVSPSLIEVSNANDQLRTSGDVSDVPHTFRNVSNLLWTLTGYMGESRVFTADASLQQQYFRNSAMGYVSNGIAYLYTVPPASTGQFIAYYAGKLNPVQPAYAQGIGFSGLSPLLPLWRAFRNIAYAFLIVIMVAIGFMVLFRMKIDPRTVISVQNALPRIILTLILITFSYAIVGLLIDIMYLTIFLVVALIGSTGLIKTPEALSQFTGGTTWNLISSAFTSGTSAVDEISNLLGGPIGNYGTALVLTGVSILAPITLLAAIPAWIAAGTGGNVFVYFIVWLAILFTLIRVLFVLINAYIQVVISLIFGPLQLMFGAIPNSNSFNSWIRGLIVNLATFPIVMLILLIAQVLSSISSTENLWRPPGLAGSFGGAVGSGVSGIIALGMMFVIPTIVDSVKEALKAKPIIPAGAGTVFAPVSNVWGTATGALSQLYYAQFVFGKEGILGKLFRRKET